MDAPDRMSDAATQPEPVQLPRTATCLSRITLRLLLGSALIGGVSAFAAAVVRLTFRGLERVLTGSSLPEPIAAAQLSPWRRAATPVVGALLAMFVLFLRRTRARRLGREPRPFVEYVEAVRHRHGCIPLLPNCWRTLSAAFSIASGAAVGREGSMIQFAAAVASRCARWRDWLDTGEAQQRSFLVACGVAAGVATAYNAPVAGVFFAAEIVLGGLAVRELLLLGVAAAAGWMVSGSMLGWARQYPMAPLHLGGWEMAVLPLVAVGFGFMGPAYQRLIRSLRGAKRLPGALVWSAVMVGLFSVHDPRVWGNGDLGLSAALGRAELPGVSIAAPALAVLLLLRLLATTACVGTGTVGGVFTPTLFAGGAAGALLGHAVGVAEPRLWALVGMSCLMAAVTHAPLMAAFVVVELTGDWRLLPVLLLLSAASWLTARRLSAEALYAIASEAPAHSPPVSEFPGAGYNQRRTA